MADKTIEYHDTQEDSNQETPRASSWRKVHNKYQWVRYPAGIVLH